MRFVRGCEIFFNAEMNFERAPLEPAAAARGQMSRLGLFGNSEQAGIEGARLGLASRRHRQLHMVDCADLHKRKFGARAHSVKSGALEKRAGWKSCRLFENQSIENRAIRTSAPCARPRRPS